MTQPQESSSSNGTISRVEFDALVATVKTQQEKQDALVAENTRLKRQIEWYRRQLFGPKSEKRQLDNPHQMHLGEGFEVPADTADSRATQKVTY